MDDLLVGSKSTALSEVADKTRRCDLRRVSFVKVAQKFAAQFSQKLTKKKLGQFVPVAGIGIGAVLNWKMVDDIADAAYWAYRERFLYEKSDDSGPIIIDAESSMSTKTPRPRNRRLTSSTS